MIEWSGAGSNRRPSAFQVWQMAKFKRVTSAWADAGVRLWSWVIAVVAVTVAVSLARRSGVDLTQAQGQPRHPEGRKRLSRRIWLPGYVRGCQKQSLTWVIHDPFGRPHLRPSLLLISIAVRGSDQPRPQSGNQIQCGH